MMLCTSRNSAPYRAQAPSCNKNKNQAPTRHKTVSPLLAFPHSHSILSSLNTQTPSDTREPNPGSPSVCYLWLRLVNKPGTDLSLIAPGLTQARLHSTKPELQCLQCKGSAQGNRIGAASSRMRRQRPTIHFPAIRISSNLNLRRILPTPSGF